MTVKQVPKLLNLHPSIKQSSPHQSIMLMNQVHSGQIGHHGVHVIVHVVMDNKRA